LNDVEFAHMVLKQIELRVFDTAVDPSAEEKIIYYKPGAQPLYRVWIYVDGPDLPFVESVTYRLHPTFEQPERTVPRTISNPSCKLEIWTWGLFEVTAVVQTKNEQRFELRHELTYDQQFAEAVSRKA